MEIKKKTRIFCRLYLFIFFSFNAPIILFAQLNKSHMEIDVGLIVDIGFMGGEDDAKLYFHGNFRFLLCKWRSQLRLPRSRPGSPGQAVSGLETGGMDARITNPSPLLFASPWSIARSIAQVPLAAEGNVAKYDYRATLGVDRGQQNVSGDGQWRGVFCLEEDKAFDLLENFNLKAIIFIGAQSSMETKFLGELGDKAKIPIISFSTPSTSPFSNKLYPYLVQIAQDETSQVAAIAAIVEAFKWKNVITIHEDSDEWRVFILHLVESLQDKNIHIAYKSSLAVSSADNQINEELNKLMAFGPTVFIVHMSPILASRLFMSAKKLGMMKKGMIGLKSYVPPSKELHNFTSRWRKKFLLETDMEVMELSPFCILAYDVAWGLAKAVERARPKEILLKEILLRCKFGGLSGDFQFINGKLVLNAFEIVNMIGKGERRVGFWTPEGKIARELYSSIHGRELSLSNTSGGLEDIIWPGGSATIPKGSVTKMSSRKLRIVVPRSGGFPELVNVSRNLQSNVTSATGFCIDVFKAAIEEVELELELEVDYEFIAFVNAAGKNIGNYSYSELIDGVYLQIQLNSKENYIGYQRHSITQGVISNLNFKNSSLQPYSSPEEYANALSRGSKNGGVFSIIDEIPYIKIFLAKYSADYAMIGSTSTTNGFAFAFRKGSPLVPYMSRAIAKDDDTSSVVRPLTLDSFRGLFLISGVSSALALAVLYGFKLYKNWHFVKNFNLRDIMWGRIKFVKEYLSINNKKIDVKRVPQRGLVNVRVEV
ncbi:hypothetical protein Pint_03112 [Pistacia integerrima]|uniref:Uncharacterized protein n=1 Tax=Pistacia integerrima TaxID=434235 RepID=A0ACC0ZGE9_9ROSI|nr:hypothetical protein Pint_03112 [Pistacia integerrima]